MRALLATLLLRTSALLPLPLAHAVGSAVGRVMAAFPNRQRRIATINIRWCFPELDEAARHGLLRRSLMETGKTAMELGVLWFRKREQLLGLVRQTSGEEMLRKALAQGNGAIIAAPHLGAWELVGLYCASKFPMTSLYRPPRIVELDTLMRGARERLGATLVPTDTGGVRSLYRALNSGELIGILPDQIPSAGTGVFAPFFGIQAYTMSLLSRLTQKTGAAVFFCYAERLPHGGGYHIHFIPASEEVGDDNPEIAATALNRGVEQCVRAVPEQYQWTYRRFHRLPDGNLFHYEFHELAEHEPDR